MSITELASERFSAIEIDTLLVLLADEVGKYIVVDNIVVAYNYHTTYWEGWIYGELKDEN